MNIIEHAPASQPAPQSLLIVDDDANVLSAFRRSIGRKWNLVTAQGGPAAITIVKEKGPFAVIITDMQMPGMNGVEFLEAVRPLAKDSVLMMLTGNVDQTTAAQAINRGHVFRFLNKPCSPETMDAAIAAGMRQYELVTAERVLLRETLAGSIRLLTDAMTLSRPSLAVATASVRVSTQRIANKIGLSADWRLPIAASLSLLGFAVMRDLSDQAMFEDANLSECAKAGAKLLHHIPRLAQVSEIVAQSSDDTPFHALSASSAVALPARVLHVAIDIERVRRGACRPGDITGPLQQDQSPVAEQVLIVVEELLKESSATTKPAAEYQSGKVPVGKLREGMQLLDDIIAQDGRTVLARGYELTTLTIERLHSYARASLIPTDIHVRWQVPPQAAAA